jgi:hypothetical protein
MVPYFGIYPYTFYYLQCDYTYPVSTLSILGYSALGLAIGLSVYWGDGNWFDIFGSLWCTSAAIAGAVSMGWYGRKEGIVWMVGKRDDRSLFTPYTVLHIASGYGIGAAAHALDMGVQSAAFTALAALLGWEVYEYWHAPTYGYWAVMNAGNSAMDIAVGMWPFMVAHNVGWDTAPWTYLVIVPGALLGHAVQCNPYEKATGKAYKGCDKGCLTYLVRHTPMFPGAKDHSQRPPLQPLDPYMTPSRAHRVLAVVCSLFCILAVFAPEQAVPCLATFVFGYALGGPSTVDVGVYERWYRAMKCDTAAVGNVACIRRGCEPGCCGCTEACACKKEKPNETEQSKEDDQVLLHPLSPRSIRGFLF